MTETTDADFLDEIERRCGGDRDLVMSTDEMARLFSLEGDEAAAGRFRGIGERYQLYSYQVRRSVERARERLA
jgi:hypothetical protein